MSAAIGGYRMGKKRNATASRYPGGQIKYDKPRPHNQRLFDIARLRDPRLSTPLGLMRYDERITEQQYEAGMAYRDAREAADRSLGLPGRHPRGQDMSAVQGLGNGLPDDLAKERREKADKRLAAMEDAIGDTATLAVMQAVVIYDLVPGGTDKVMLLIRGLTRLAAWRKVTGRGR